MPDDVPATCFIDTNIWLYAFIEGDDSAKSVAARALIQETEPVLSTQVINEVCVNLLRRANFSEEQVRQLIGSFIVEGGRVGAARMSPASCRPGLSVFGLGKHDLLAAAQRVRSAQPTASRHTVFHTLAVPHEDLMPGKVQILDPQASEVRTLH
jgi:predicted nucleic acid-binding protein